jgi:D-amino-acid oxidase
VSYRKFAELAKSRPEAGVLPMDIRAIFDNEPKDSGILSEATGKVWYEEITGGLRYLEDEELPKGASFAFEVGTFVIDVSSYLPWYGELQSWCFIQVC